MWGLPGCGGHWFRVEVLVGFHSPLEYHQQRKLGVTIGVSSNRTGLSSCWLLWHSHRQTGGSVSTCFPLAGIPWGVLPAVPALQRDPNPPEWCPVAARAHLLPAEQRSTAGGGTDPSWAVCRQKPQLWWKVSAWNSKVGFSHLDVAAATVVIFLLSAHMEQVHQHHEGGTGKAEWNRSWRCWHGGIQSKGHRELLLILLTVPAGSVQIG